MPFALPTPKPPESEMVKVGEKASPYAGAATMGGQVVGAGLGALGFLIPGAGLALGPALMGMGSQLGGYFGDFFEPDPEDIMVEQFKPQEPMQQPLPRTPLLTSSQIMRPEFSYSQQYGVSDLYGFGR